MTYKKSLGNKGEEAAASYLIKNGCEILERNYKTKVGEVDIICKQGDYLVFVEVKTRSGGAFGRPGEAVGLRKQQKIKSVAEWYILKNALFESRVRFDVAEVFALHGPNKYEVEIIQNAF